MPILKRNKAPFTMTVYFSFCVQPFFIVVFYLCLSFDIFRILYFLAKERCSIGFPCHQITLISLSRGLKMTSGFWWPQAPVLRQWSRQGEVEFPILHRLNSALWIAGSNIDNRVHPLDRWRRTPVLQVGLPRHWQAESFLGNTSDWVGFLCLGCQSNLRRVCVL